MFPARPFERQMTAA